MIRDYVYGLSTEQKSQARFQQFNFNLLLNYLIRLCPLNPRFYGAETNTSPLKTAAYSYLRTTKISLNSTSVINII
jgi:hypothetical protein